MTTAIWPRCGESLTFALSPFFPPFLREKGGFFVAFIFYFLFFSCSSFFIFYLFVN